MPQLHAQPYDLSATGFYFDDFDSFQEKVRTAVNAYGDPVEEFELQFIDGDHIDCDLANTWGINQANVKQYFDAVENWDNREKQMFIIAVGEGGYSFDPDTVAPSDFDVDIYHARSMKDLAEDFVADGIMGDVPEHLAHYIDYDAIARDLALDYTETEIAGDHLIYRLG